MGDNANFNDCVAAHLGLPRGNCLAHAFNLLALAFALHFPAFETQTNTLGRVIHDGGTTKRAEELREFEGNDWEPNKLSGYKGRFGSSLGVAKHLLSSKRGNGTCEVLKAVIGWLRTGKSLQQEKQTDANCRLQEVRKAFYDPQCVLQLFVVYEVLAEIPHLIEMASADAHNVNPALLSRMHSFRTTLDYIKDSFAEATIEDAMSKFQNVFPNELGINVKVTMLQMLQKGIDAMLLKWERHVVPAIEFLRFRFLLDPRNEPVPFPLNPGRHHSAYDIQMFFGCLPEYANAKLLGEWMTYTAEWKELRSESAKMTIGTFWLSMESRFPILSKVGRWYAEASTSSISAERAFSIMRTMENPRRFSMKKKAFQTELFVKLNDWVVEELLERECHQLQKLTMESDH